MAKQAKPVAPTQTVKKTIVYAGRVDVYSRWYYVTPELIAAPRALGAENAAYFSAKAGRGKIVGGVYTVDASEDGATIMLNTMQFASMWPVAEDCAQWSVSSKYDAVVELLEPVR